MTGIPGYDEWKTATPPDDSDPPSHCDNCRELIDADDPHLCKCKAGRACALCVCDFDSLDLSLFADLTDDMHQARLQIEGMRDSGDLRMGRGALLVLRGSRGKLAAIIAKLYSLDGAL